MPLPITLPYTFATSTSAIPLANLDSDLSTITTAVNGLGSGTYTLATPVLGAATATSLIATGSVLSSGTSGLGYSTGAGSTVTQATSKSTGVTLNKICGQITMNNAALAAGAEATFTVTNSTILSTDVVIVNHASAGTAGAYLVSISSVATGSFGITVSNVSAGSLSQAIVLNYAIIKSVSA
jgi:hypothetical protein